MSLKYLYFALFIKLLSTSFYCDAQVGSDSVSSFDTTAYFISQVPDSIVIYRNERFWRYPEKKFAHLPKEEYEEKMQRYRNCVDKADYVNIQEFDMFFKRKYVLKEQQECIAFSKLFPIDNCGEDYSRSRCVPIFRDILVFYKEGEFFYVIKICFECGDVTSVPLDQRIYCLQNEDKFQKFYQYWIYTKGWINLFGDD